MFGLLNNRNELLIPRVPNTPVLHKRASCRAFERKLTALSSNSIDRIDAFVVKMTRDWVCIEECDCFKLASLFGLGPK